MIGKVMSSIVPKAAAKCSSQGGTRLNKFLKSSALGKVLDVAADNPTLCQAGFSLALCCIARPITNYLVTKDKQDATYASCHSISSGLIGFFWPMVFVNPLSGAVKKVMKNPVKYLKPETIKKFYPNVGTKDILDKNGKKVATKIRVNLRGEMLRKDGTVLLRDLEPKMVYGDAEKIKFEKEHPDFYVSQGGVVRSRKVFQTEKGKIKLDKDGNKVGCPVQSDFTPITEEMEIGIKKEQNVKNFINMVPDIILAPARAALTIAMIPPILKNVFGVKKGSSNSRAAENNNSNNNVNTGSKPQFTASIINQSSPFMNFKKGGM